MKLLTVYSRGQNGTDFTIVFPEPLIMPKNAQVCVFTVRGYFKDSAAFAAGQASVVVCCPSFNAKTFVGARSSPNTNGFTSSAVSLPLMTAAAAAVHTGQDELTMGSKVWLDLNNSEPLSFTSLQFTINYIDGTQAVPLDGLDRDAEFTEIHMGYRQDPVFRQSELLAQAIRRMNYRKDHQETVSGIVAPDKLDGAGLLN